MSYGALENEWVALANSVGCEDLLPVVSNPHAAISPNSLMKTLGKTPSRYNSLRQVGGIKEWTKYKATKTDISNWAKEPDYGVCIQTRHVRALDIDVEDIDLANNIIHSILSFFPHAHFRTRNNSAKFLFPFFLEGDYTKRTITTEKGIIEFLANGNQFVAAGTHPSGERYNLDPSKIIKITPDEFNSLFSHIVSEYAIENYSQSRTRNPKCEPMEIEDNTVDLLKNKNLVLGTGHEGQLFIKCPFEHEHTTPNTITGTTYFPAGTRAYYNGHFHCFHAHCQHRTDDEFKLALDLFEDFATLEDVADRTPDPSLETGDIYMPSGLIKDTAEWITNSAFKRQPSLSLLSTLAFGGAVFGRRYATAEDTRTNIYTVGIAGPGEGKDHPRKRIKALAEAACLSQFVGPDDFKSGEGTCLTMIKQPSVYYPLDEIGVTIQAISSPTAQSYQRSIGKYLLVLYSSSSSIYHGGVYATKDKEPIIINQPNLCIFGTSTYESYKSAVNLRTAATGELSRFIVLTPDNELPYFTENPTASMTPPSHLVQRWSKFLPDVFEPDNVPAITLVGYTNSARDFIKNSRIYEVDMQRKYSYRNGDGSGPIYARYTENIIKIAMIYAIADNMVKPIITVDHLKGGESVVKNGTLFIQALINAGMIEDVSPVRKEFAGDADKILGLLKANGRLSKSEILRKMRHLSAGQLSTLLSTMLERHEISREEDTVKGKTTTYYHAIKSKST